MSWFHKIISSSVFAILFLKTIQILFKVYEAYDEFAAGIVHGDQRAALIDTYQHVSVILLISCSAAWMIESIVDRGPEGRFPRAGIWSLLLLSLVWFVSPDPWLLVILSGHVLITATHAIRLERRRL